MAVLRESPWYQEILREGERQGDEQLEVLGEALLDFRQPEELVGGLESDG